MWWKKIIGSAGVLAAVLILLVNVWMVLTAQAEPLSNVVIETSDHYVIHLTNIADTATDESAAVKVDRSGLTARDGGEPASLDLEQIEWNIQGYTYISLLWDQPTTDDQMVILNGSGYKDFRGINKGLFGIRRTSGLQDPRDSLGTGDVIMNTSDSDTGATYDITLWLRKTPD